MITLIELFIQILFLNVLRLYAHEIVLAVILLY
jgi:hypothetical protein